MYQWSNVLKYDILCTLKLSMSAYVCLISQRMRLRV